MAVNKKPDKRFQNLTVDYRSLMRLNVSERMNMLSSVEGRSVIASIEPDQVAAAFPNYYRKDTNTFGKRLQGLMSNPDSATKPQSGDRSSLSESNRSSLGVGRRRSDVGAQAQLSKEQKETFELLQKGKIDADDPRVAFLKSISEADLKKFGINASTGEDGKKSFAMEPTKASQMTDEDIIKTIPKPSSTPAIEALKSVISKGEGDYHSYNRGKAGDTPKSSRTNDITKMTVGDILKAQQGPNRQFFAVGKYQFIPETLKAAVKHTGIDLDSKFDGAAQEKLFEYLISSAKRPKLAAYLEGRSTDINGAMNDLAYEFASIPGPDGRGKYDGDKAGNKAAGGIQKAQQVQSILQKAQSEKLNPVAQAGETAPTPEQIQSARQKQEQQESISRQAGLASIISRNQRASSADVAVHKKSDTEAKIYYAGDSIGHGVGTAAGGVSLAQSGKKFTDPTILQQLAKVPKGSTVELHGGTNDAVSGVTDPEAYRQQMKNIADLAKANGITVNVNGPPKSKKNWDKNAEAVDTAMSTAAQESGLNYRTLRQYTPPERSDGVHFDNKGYQSMIRPLPEPQQQAVAPVEPEPISSMPDGGDLQTDAESLSVYQMDKNKLQRDDSIALDDGGKPVFTMNSKESMKFDPNTGKVEVDNGSKGLRNDPNQLGPAPEPTARDRYEEKVVQATGPVAAATRADGPPPQSSTQSSYDLSAATMSMTDNMFKSPSFERAIARTRFHNSGDAALGGHFDGKAANMV